MYPGNAGLIITCAPKPGLTASHPAAENLELRDRQLELGIKLRSGHGAQLVNLDPPSGAAD